MNVDYVCQNYFEYETDKKFDLIIMIFCDFCALSPAQRQTMLEKYNKFLMPGGHVLLDVHSLNFLIVGYPYLLIEYRTHSIIISAENYIYRA